MEKIKRFFECLIPITVCNLECEYCYVIQENRRSMKMSNFKYKPEWIIKCLNKERLGGTCLFSICGAGETLIQKEVSDIVIGLANEGHYVNITNNGTQTKEIKKIINSVSNTNHLLFSFSLHYNELLKRNLLNTFFDNVLYCRNNGASILVQLNLYDGYINKIKEIKDICIEKIGAFPQVPTTRDESTKPFKFHTKYSNQNYYKYGKMFNSPLFDFTYEKFNEKRNEFCYAGDWSGVLDIETGFLKKCYANMENNQNIFENPYSKINFSAIGSHCKSPYCINNSHFLSLGVIPSLKTPSYSDLRNRICIDGTEWQEKTMKYVLNTKLSHSNKEYSFLKKIYINYVSYLYLEAKKIIDNLFKKMWRGKKIVKFIINNIFPLGKKIFIIGTPEHSNIGDSAITIAQLQYFERLITSNRIKEITLNEFYNYRKWIKYVIRKYDLITIPGGGNMGNQWKNEENNRYDIINDFKENNIIIFPQTIYFVNNNQSDIERSKLMYENHNNLYMFAREDISYEIMKKMYKNPSIKLAPDIVLSTNMNSFGAIKNKKNGVLLCIRNDEEKKISNKIWEIIKGELNNMHLKFRVIDMISSKNITKENRDECVKEKMQEFCDAKLVITDRLHAMIFAAITETPCIVFSNYNYKIKGCYKWIKHLKYIKYVENVEDAIKNIKPLLKMKNCIFNNNCILDKYNQLEEVILECLK